MKTLRPIKKVKKIKKYKVNPKLTKDQRKAIRLEYKNGGGTSKYQTETKVSIHALMKKYKASYGTIWNIIHKADLKKK